MVSKILRNNNESLNSLPKIPSNLKTFINGYNVTFKWDKSTDNETPQNGLTYNLSIGTSPGACDILSPMSDLNTGKRRIVGMGNAGHCNSKTIKGLADGKYYWSVQAIDNNFAGSGFAETRSFTLPFQETITITYPKGGEIFEVGSNPNIIYNSDGTSGYLNFDYSTDGGITWYTIATNQLDDGGYKGWIVPNTPSVNCKIRISDVEGAPSAVSDGLFTITNENPNLNKGLVAYYSFYKNANDASGNGFNGSLIGGASWVNDRFDNQKSAISFDGTNGRVEVPHRQELNLDNDTISVSMWFNIAEHVQYGGLICKGSYISNYCISDRFDRKLAIDINHYSATNTQELLTTKTFSTNEWHHLVAMFSSSEMKIFIDGQFDNQMTVSKQPMINSETLYFGVDADGDWEYLKGELDEVRIYNRALTDLEIIKLYNEQSKTITITYPKGGETFEAGSNPIITYSSLGNSGYINLEYSIDGGITWNTIANNQLDDGDYKEWIIPNTPSDKCKIRITDVDGDPSVISDSLFTITGVVPVELVAFTSDLKEDKIIINWKTATETNNKGFEVERKLNSGWEKIGYIDGHGTTTIPTEYNYTDNFKYQSYRGIASYRLKQIDLDGSYHYSEEIKISIDFTPKEFILYQNYPNPFNPNTVIKYALPYESSVDIIIYNMIGQRVEEFKEGIKEAGYHNVNWQPGNISSGVYFYSINAKSTDGKNNYSKTLKMLYMK